MRHIKVLSYNIHKGFSAGNRKFVLPQIKKSIQIVQADLVFLQEVQGSHETHSRKFDDWPADSQFEFLADTVWDHFAYGKNAVYTEGHHGNAILSKFPILSWENIDVSTNTLEQRGILHAEIDVPDSPQPLHAICIHFDLFESGRRLQLERLAARIASTVPSDAPLVISGDFNDWRNSATRILAPKLGVREVFAAIGGQHARTFPAVFPVLQLDRIYVRGVDIVSGSVHAKGVWGVLSDHAALSADLAITASK